MRIVWLASYPRSGNTFLRFLIYSYLFPEVIDTQEIKDFIPDIHELLSNKVELETELDISLLIKTHFCWSEHHPYAENTTGFIYILRDPRDVLLSNGRYLGAIENGKVNEDFAKTFITCKGVPRWEKMGMGTWPLHIASWLADVAQIPHLFLTYEELRLNTESALEKVIRFLDIDIDRISLQRAVQVSSIESMRNLEIQEKAAGKYALFEHPKNIYPFVGQGKINQSLTPISEEIEILYKQHFEFASVFGYN